MDVILKKRYRRQTAIDIGPERRVQGRCRAVVNRGIGRLVGLPLTAVVFAVVMLVTPVFRPF